MCLPEVRAADRDPSGCRDVNVCSRDARVLDLPVGYLCRASGEFS